MLRESERDREKKGGCLCKERENTIERERGSDIE